MALTYSGRLDQYGENSVPDNVNKSAYDVDESFFKNIEYFLVDKGKPEITFTSNSLTFSTTDKKAISSNPKGEVYRELNEDPIHFEAKLSNVNFEKKELHLENEVKVNLDNVELRSNLMKIFTSENLLVANGNVQTLSNSKNNSEQILISAGSAIYRPKISYFEYRDGVNGTLKRKKEYEESIRFKANNLDFDGLKSLANLKGEVHLMRENYDVFANQGTIYLENYNKKLKYYSFSDDVRLEERVKSDGRLFTRRAFSEKLEGIMSEKKIILSGLPKVFQDKDVIKGNLIVIRENVETVEVDDANTNITLKHE